MWGDMFVVIKLIKMSHKKPPFFPLSKKKEEYKTPLKTQNQMEKGEFQKKKRKKTKKKISSLTRHSKNILKKPVKSRLNSDK